jgi:exodeoxyribonuclease V alpha subunit
MTLAEGSALRGIVERITYNSPDTGYTVAKFNSPTALELITVVGHFGALVAGESLKLYGAWKDHPRHGTQFLVARYEQELPATLVGLEKYLGSGLIKGIGPATAKRLVGHFGLEILSIMEEAPERLIEVPSVGGKRARLIGKAWHEQKSIQEVMLFLQGHGVSTTHAVKIFKAYGEKSVGIVVENPYRLAQDIWGIGFKTADAIAKKLGLAPDAPSRLTAGLQHALSEASEEGHLFLPLEDLLKASAELLGIEAQALETIVEASIQSRLLIRHHVPPHEAAIYLPPLWHAEQGVAKRLKRLIETPAEVPNDLEEALGLVERAEGLVLSSEQRAAVLMALHHRVFILTGGPGTGKTTTVRAIVKLLAHYEQKILLASPTGRAAKRLSEVTGHEAKTLHRLLEFQPAHMGFTRGPERPLEADVVLVDEASMLDTLLANSLLKALPPLGHLILVGDADQLPSVGPGSVLGDLLSSGRVPEITLQQVFRQAESSLIITNAHRIRRGEFPQLIVPDGKRSADCYFLEADSPESAVAKVLNAVSKSLPSRLGFEREDIQVLTPMNRGSAGAQALNNALQAALNPALGDRPSVQSGSRVFRVGDKVIQLRNNYDKNVFNGDMGIIQGIDTEEQMVLVKHTDGTVPYDYAELDELALAYAISVHKSQGSEFKAVVIPLLTQHYPMLQRNLLYTALTRAKQVVVLVGQRRAIGMALGRNDVSKRFTGLKAELTSL